MFCANAVWGLMSPGAKMVIASGAATALVDTDLRFFGAMILFWLVSFFQKPEHVNHRDMAKIFLASLLAIVLNQGLFMFGVGLTSPVNASIWGDVLVVLAQLSYATYFVLFKRFVGRYSMVTLMKWMFTFAFIATLPLSYRSLLATQWAAFDARTWGAVAFIVVGGTFLSYSLIVIGQKNLRPTVGGMYNYVQPVVASIAAIYWGLDRFDASKAMAVALIAGGVYLVTISRSRAQLEAYKAKRDSRN